MSENNLPRAFLGSDVSILIKKGKKSVEKVFSMPSCPFGNLSWVK